VAPQELDPDTDSDHPSTGSQPLSTSEGQPIALSSKVTLDNNIHTQLYYTHKSSKSTVEDLESLACKVTLEDDIELEDPPKSVEDPADQRNPPSLADCKDVLDVVDHASHDTRGGAGA
jgi:5-methylcytosine-specific restriction endonuclease McrA